jgi:hypothetical protein
MEINYFHHMNKMGKGKKDLIFFASLKLLCTVGLNTNYVTFVKSF